MDYCKPALYGVILFLQVACSCSSPLDRAQSQIEAIVEQMPVTEGTNLLCVDRFERLSGQGVGTHTGRIILYGTDQDYQQVVDFYRDSLTMDGWAKFGNTTLDHPWYCNPQHEGMRLELRRVANDVVSCDDPATGNIDRDYQTFHVLDVRVFPFDYIGGCGDTD